MALTDELPGIAAAAESYAGEGEELEGILATEPVSGVRTYICAYSNADGGRTWLALDADGRPVERRALVRDALSIAAMCEIAEESAGGGRLDELRERLVSLRLTENPPGIDEAEEAALELERALEPAPRLARPEYLDTVGAATRKLERALGDETSSPFTLAMRVAVGAVEELAQEVERNYKLALT